MGFNSGLKGLIYKGVCDGVDIVARLQAGRSGVQGPAGNFSVFQNVRTGVGAKPAFC